MDRQAAREEYQQALKQGQKELKSLQALGKPPYPAVLDEILPEKGYNIREMGTLEIPAGRIVGTVSAGRTGAFTAGFLPLLGADSEFGTKWIDLCAAHLAEGIRDPILCFEYLGNFYVQEGNKRVSVLKRFGAPRIFATVRRILPPLSEEPRIRAYYEFLEFYEDTKLYLIQFRRPGDYALLLSHLGKEPGEAWEEREVRTFRSWYQYFLDAFAAQKQHFDGLLPEEALLLWLQVYPVRELGAMTSAQLRKSLEGLKAELEATPRDAGSGLMVVENGMIGGIPVFCTNEIDTDSASYVGFGIWSNELLGQFGDMRYIVDPTSLADEDSIKHTLNGEWSMTTVRKEAFVLGSFA